MGQKRPTLVFGVEVHVTRASSFPKIKARFHILMLVSWLWDQNDQLWFLGSKFTLQLYTHRYLCNDMVREGSRMFDAINTRLWVTRFRSHSVANSNETTPPIPTAYTSSIGIPFNNMMSLHTHTHKIPYICGGG